MNCRFFADRRLLGVLSTLVFIQNLTAEYPDLARLKLAAESSDAAAEYEYGRAISSSNRTDSANWIKKAADQGFAPAEKAWGERCEQQSGFDQKSRVQLLRQAVWWTGRSAYHGYAPAQEQLGIYYYEAVTVPKDPITGYMWLKIALENPSADLFTRSAINSHLNTFVANMSSADIREGERRAREFSFAEDRGMNPIEAALILNDLHLTAILQSGERRIALINHIRFGAGDIKSLPFDGRNVSIRCFSIEAKSAQIGISGTRYQILLVLQ